MTWLAEAAAFASFGAVVVMVFKTRRMRNRAELMECEFDDIVDQINAAKKAYDEALEAINTIATEARQAFIMSHDTRERVLPIVMAKLKIKAEGGTLH